MQTLFHDSVAAGPLPAHVVCCTDRAEFQAAAALDSFNFNGCNADPEFTEYPDGLTVQGFHFCVSCHADFPAAVLVYAPDACAFGAEGFSKGGLSVLYAGGAKALHVTLPAGVTALGLDFSAEGQNSTETLHASIGGETFTIHTSGAGAKQAHSFFAGFLSTFPITQISFSGSDAGPILSSVCYGHADSALDAFRAL